LLSGAVAATGPPDRTDNRKQPSRHRSSCFPGRSMPAILVKQDAGRLFGDRSPAGTEDELMKSISKNTGHIGWLKRIRCSSAFVRKMLDQERGGENAGLLNSSFMLLGPRESPLLRMAVPSGRSTSSASADDPVDNGSEHTPRSLLQGAAISRFARYRWCIPVDLFQARFLVAYMKSIYPNICTRASSVTCRNVLSIAISSTLMTCAR